MHWNLLLAAEIAQTTASALCLLAVLITLKDAIAVRRRVIKSGQNHGADIWSWINVRGKGCLTAVELIILAAKIERANLAFGGYQPPSMARWTMFGIGYTLVAALVAATAIANMASFHKLRDQ